jgi:hypothetical protein
VKDNEYENAAPCCQDAYDTGFDAGKVMYKKWFESSVSENNTLRFEIIALRKDLDTLHEALLEFTKPPYPDSDLSSLMEWVNARAKAVLEQIEL